MGLEIWWYLKKIKLNLVLERLKDWISEDWYYVLNKINRINIEMKEKNKGYFSVN